jgi:uncharacterized protein YbbC (DUF1343 family)/CubicO group peptidase (beta-lactamase class C family)
VLRLVAPWCALLALVLLAPPGVALAQIPDFSAIDDAVTDALRSGEIPGVVVLVGRNGETLYHRAFGSRAVVPDPVPMTTDTIFDVASLTKPLGTTLAVLALAERGALSLDAPLGRYLKEFRGRAYKDVSVRRMLTHSAGLPSIPAPGTLSGGFPGAARALARKPLDYRPGTGFQYSDTGFILLGEVVRRVSGEPLDVFLARLLFQPLGLRDTSFHPPAKVLARVAPTEFHAGILLQGRVHDPRARLLDGVAGHAGMFSTAADLSRLLRMLLAGGELDGQRILKAATVRLMWTPVAETDGNRALGWDVSSAFSRTMAPFFPSGSVGHTGFTGTAVWVDPNTRTYMILLTNRVHPNGGGAARIQELRSRVAAAVGSALFRGAPPASAAAAGPAADADTAPTVPALPRAQEPVRTGLDRVVADGFALFKGKSIALVTNQTGLDVRGRRGIDLFAAAPNVRLRAVFSPEHGITGSANTDVPHGKDPATGVPIWSLYGPARRPTPEMLQGVDMLVFDVQDVGVRYYTYLTTLLYVMEEAARHNLSVVVLDRPNPITGRVVEGPVMDPDLRSFTGPHPLPVRTGLTIGEFGRLAAAERKLGVRLTVVPLAGWERGRWYDETGLPWVNPSPNIRSVTQALLYAGVGLLEATNLSVGRGTDLPFEVIGAPWLDGMRVADAMNRRGLAGIRFEPITFTPTGDRYARTACGGVRMIVTDRDAVRPVTVGLALAASLRQFHRGEFKAEGVQNLLVNRATMWALLRGEPFERLRTWAEIDRSSFLTRRASYLMY